MRLKSLNMNDNLMDSVIVKKLLNYFLIADYSQTYYYNGKVSSLKYLIREGDDNTANKVIDEIENALVSLYSTYYNDVNISVGKAFENNNNLYSIFIEIQVTNNEGLTTILKEQVNDNNPYDSVHFKELKKIKV